MATSCVAEQPVVTDPDLVTLEFEAIIAANFPPSAGRTTRRPPTVRRATATQVEVPNGRTPRRHRAATGGLRTADRRRRARQRSPPARAAPASTDP